MAEFQAPPVPLPTAEDILASTARLSARPKVTITATRPTLPYFAPAELLPAPLPTVPELLAHARAHNVGPKGGEIPSRFGEHFGIIVGQHSLLQEGENMLFVQQSTNVPVPKLYALFHDEKTGYNFLIQEWIPGQKLRTAWKNLDTDQKRAAALQVHRHVDELRSIPSPDYYGGLWGQPPLDMHFNAHYLAPPEHLEQIISGPHETEEKWTSAMMCCFELRAPYNWPNLYELPVKQRLYQSVFQGHPSVFTHTKLCTDNLVLREDGTVVMVNWRRSGWYPSYWEYCCAMMTEPNDDWTLWVHDEMLEQYITELLMMSHNRLMHKTS
ncbi:hypothetical protein B0I37DRAFT_428854 [Chaetomium sp. MPI-CAGE-AT-0009]|nr:hypothetical protein B0I37DRAFT_428854 [Chaetomium sp. MPI-CAGE-AT-0009]